MRIERVNTEWLSLHQCIDEHCPVHYSFKNTHDIEQSAVFKAEIPKSMTYFENTHDNIISNSDNQGNVNEELARKQRDFDKDDKEVVTLDLSQRPGALKTIAQCYEDKTVTCSPSKNLKILMQEYGDDTKSTLEKTDCDNIINLEITDVAKPRFMCKWLDQNVDINKFPFYKLALYYGSQKKVREDAAVYSNFVTSQIWSSHRYIGSSEDDTGNNENSCSTRVSGSKASRSRENLFHSIDSVIKDIPGVDISDLKLKYRFLFHPNFIFKKKDAETNCGVQNENIGTQKSCQYLNHNGEIANCTDGSFNESNYVRPGNVKYSKRYINQNFSGRFVEGNDETKPIPVQQKTLICENSCNSLNDLPIQTDRSEGYNSPGNVDINACIASPYNSKLKTPTDKRRSVREYSRDTRPTRQDYFINHNESTVFRDCLDISAHLNTKTNIDNNVSVTCSPYSPDPRLRKNGYEMENSEHQTRSIAYPNSSYKTGSPYYTNALNVSPLVSSPVFSHYVSPVGNLTGHSLHFFTGRNRDPRIQACDSKITSDRLRVEGRTESQRLVQTPNKVLSRTTYDENHTAYHGLKKREHENKVNRNKECCKDQFHSEDEDPLNGFAECMKTIRQSSLGKYIESPNSEIFYNINGDRGKKEQYVDGVMDLFYAENCYPEKDAIRNNGSPFINRQKSRSPGRPRYREIRSRSRRSPRVRSRSRETTLPTSRYMFPRFSSADTKHHYIPNNLRYSDSQGKHRKYRHFRERSVSKIHRKMVDFSCNCKRRSCINDVSYKERKLERRKRQEQDSKREKTRTSRSPSSTSSRLANDYKQKKTGFSSISFRSFKSEIIKRTDLYRYKDHKCTAKDTRKKNNERPRHKYRR